VTPRSVVCRAQFISITKITRLFQQLGIADEITDHNRALSVYEFRKAEGETLMRFDNHGVRLAAELGSEGRLDDLLGNEFWLISRNRLDGMPISHVKALRLGYDLFEDSTIEQWLDQPKAEAVIVRPDRYVFGTGSAEALANPLRSALAPTRTLSTDQVRDP
jgi:hypothetical protein